MILKAIISFIVFIIEGLAKLVYFLLTALGLWIPAVFSFIFLIVCLATGTNLNDVTLIYLFGLGLTVIFSVALAVLQVMRKRDMRASKRTHAGGGAAGYVSKARRRDDAAMRPRPASHNGGAYGQGEADAAYYAQYPAAYAAPDQAPQDRNTHYYAPPPPQAAAYGTPPQGQGYPAQDYPPQGYPQAAPPPPQGQLNLYGQPMPQQGYPQQSAYGQTPPPQDAQLDGYNGKYGPLEPAPPTPPQTAPPSLTARDEPTGHPRIFKTRMDPNMLVYEYDDRLMFFKRTSHGLIHLSTELKNMHR
ncbi:MAG: hypothetical protein LBH24_02845 [Clostridiales bacterium]|jgi:membrane protein implicated in regulation of membrane protease activity|nr:hypothetical protein [Clostridiales bacterium]